MRGTDPTTSAQSHPGLSLRALFILTVTGVLITTSILLGWLLSRDRAASLQSDLEAKGVSLAQILAHHAEYGVLVGDYPGLERLIEGLRHDSDVIWAAVLDGDGKTLATGPKERSKLWKKAAQGSRAPSKTLDASVTIAHRASSQGAWVILEAPVWTVPVARSREEIGLGASKSTPAGAARERIGTVTLVLSKARVLDALSNARWMVAFVTLWVVALGVLLTLPLAHVIIGPVQQLARASRRIAGGEMGVQVPEPSSREMADLTRSFNEMVESLRERDARLQENAAELERRAQALRARQEELQAMNQALEAGNQALRLSHGQLRTVNAELMHASRLKSEFLASMSHELRTPLNSIIGYTECMIDGLDGPITEDQAESLERVCRNGRHLLGLINDILDLSKIESGKLELSISDIVLADLAEECLAMMRPLIRGKDLVLTCQVAPDLPPFRADVARVRQVLINLLNNGVKFTEHGEVSLRIFSTDGGVALVVRDTGKGIPAEELEVIFQEFHQLEGPNASGTGLGLAISKRLLERMGGTIGVESVPGEGATFTVWLPTGRTEGSIGLKV